MENMQWPEVVFGTSALGNLYVALSDDVKSKIVAECIHHGGYPAFFDSAGKYGAGLALESLGQCLKLAGARPSDVMISNKLGWLRTELKTPEPTFERGIWKELKYDAVQQISYEGILACYEQGNNLLNGYKAGLVSVHDPDEYLAGAGSDNERKRRYQDILNAYKALIELKAGGLVKGVGIGAKDWRVIRQISRDVRLDWVMIANSMTIHSHPADLTDFMRSLERQGIAIINSAVFNGGFLTGLDFYNYQKVSLQDNPELYGWRDRFYRLCADHQVKPETACAAFSKQAPGVKSIALSTSNPNRVKQNINMFQIPVPTAFWHILVGERLIDAAFAESYLF